MLGFRCEGPVLRHDNGGALRVGLGKSLEETLEEMARRLADPREHRFAAQVREHFGGDVAKRLMEASARSA